MGRRRGRSFGSIFVSNFSTCGAKIIQAGLRESRKQQPASESPVVVYILFAFLVMLFASCVALGGAR